MEQSFDSKEYVNQLAHDLIRNFERAGSATTPVLVGSSKEKEVRAKFEKIFPPLICIGTGCVIDSSGYTSKQTDVIIFEKDFCPVFSINDTPEASYYPCESVISVGEIKSVMNTKELLDSIAKIESIKISNRFKTSPSIRGYGSKSVIYQNESRGFNQREKTLDQIHGFILCEKFGLSVDTILLKLGEIYRNKEAYLLPNLIVSLNDGLIVFLNKNQNTIMRDKNNAEGIAFFNNPEGNFQFLITDIYHFITHGRTTNILPFEKYVISEIDDTHSFEYKFFEF